MYTNDIYNLFFFRVAHLKKIGYVIGVCFFLIKKKNLKKRIRFNQRRKKNDRIIKED